MRAQRQHVRRGSQSAIAKPYANALAGLAAARAALEGEGAPLSAEQALAQQEQWRVEDEARRNAQATIPFGPIA